MGMGAGTPKSNMWSTGTGKRGIVMEGLNGLGLAGCTRPVGNTGEMCGVWTGGYLIVFCVLFLFVWVLCM